MVSWGRNGGAPGSRHSARPAGSHPTHVVQAAVGISGNTSISTRQYFKMEKSESLELDAHDPSYMAELAQRIKAEEVSHHARAA